MIRKKDKLIITFYTTTDAMHMESVCKRTNTQGRMIPVPREISAGCGLAWCVDPKYEDEVMSQMTESMIRYQEVHRCMI